ncbi:MAG: DUF4012 domain-containing protein [Candidatus Levyibacteriota bacterium]
MDEISKIELDSKNPTPSSPIFEHMRKFKLPKRTAIVVLSIILLVAVGFFFMVLLPAQKTYSAGMTSYAQAHKAWDAVKKQNIDQTITELESTKKELGKTQNSLNSLSFLKYIPIASGYYNDADHLVKAGFYGLDAALTVANSLKPYEDVLGLKGKGSFVMGSAEQRVQLAIMTMGKITPHIDDVAGSLSLAKKEIEQVDQNHYPSIFGGEKIRDQLISVKSIARQSLTFVAEARPLIKILPSLLGDTKERKYLVLFQNNAELRPTGGFITAYAIFRIDKGVIHVDRSDDIYSLDNAIGKKAKAPAPILKYLPNVYTFNLRDSNISSDFIESMKTFDSMYKLASNKVNVDGIIAIDTHVLVSVIKILDDKVNAAGMTFTSKEDPRCNCPQVIFALEDTISRPVNYQKSGRKDLLGTLLYAIMEKALSSSPKVYWGPLFQSFLTETSQKHVLFYLFNEDAQSGVEALNAAGRIKSFDGDYLHINEANFGGQKSNLYVQENVEQSYEVKNDGSIVKTVTINYKNPEPPSDCNLERGNLCLNAILRNWFRIYVPKGSVMLNSQGSEVKMTSYEELGKTVFDGFLTVRPLGAAKFTISYKLPFKLKSGSPLPLLIQKQPGTDKNEYVIKINGKQVEKFLLLTDKEVKLSF